MDFIEALKALIDLGSTAVIAVFLVWRIDTKLTKMISLLEELSRHK